MSGVSRTICIVGILAFGVLLRFLLLSEQSLWFDEAFTYSLVSKDLATALAAEKNNPPLYVVLLHFWTQFFGLSEAGLRSFSAFASSITLLLMIPVGGLFVSRKALPVLVLLLALSSFHLYYAQEVRCFALLNCWLLGYVYFLERFSRSPGVLFAVGAVLFAEFSLYTHFISVFFIATGFFYGVFRLRADRKALLMLIVFHTVIVLLFAPWLLMMLQAASGGGQLRKYLLLKVPQTFVSFLFGDSLIPLGQDVMKNLEAFLRVYAVPLALAALVSVGLAILTLVNLLKSRTLNKQLLIWMFAFVPVLFVFLVSFRLMMLDERYLQFSSIFVFAILAEMFVSLWHRKTVKGLFALFLFLQTWSVWNYFTDARFGKEQWREVVAFVEPKLVADAPLMFDVGYLDIAYGYYQSKQVETIRAVSDYSSPQEPPFEWETRLETVDELILVRSHYLHDAVLEVLLSNYRIHEKRIFPNGKGITVYVLKRQNV